MDNWHSCTNEGMIFTYAAARKRSRGGKKSKPDYIRAKQKGRARKGHYPQKKWCIDRQIYLIGEERN